MRKRTRRRFHTFMEKQKALLLVLLAVALLDFVVSGVSMKEISRETGGWMQRLAALHMQQVYEEYSRIGYDMRRLLMENENFTNLAQYGSEKDKIYAKNNLIARMGYSFGEKEDFHLFYYFEETEDILTGGWLDMQEAKESGILGVVLDKMNSEEELTIDLHRWDYFEHAGCYYMLRAYRYNGVWFVCYVPAERLIASLEKSYQGEAAQVLLFSGDGALLSGREKIKDWEISEEILKKEGSFFRFPFTRIQIVREESALLDFSIAVVMKGYGGFSRIVAVQAVVFFMVVLTLGAFILMNIYTRKRIIAPVQKFVRGLQSYQEGSKAGAELSVSDFHELEQVNEQFRNFVHQIGALKINVYEEKLLRQKMENDNLKLQLKPHFFLNTLGMVCQLLDKGRVEESKQMCQASIRYLRYIFRADMEHVCVGEAILHVEDYMEIMKLRYPGEVEPDIFMEEGIKDCLIPPLIIQTLVENSLKYGKQAERKLEISVTVTTESKGEEKLLCINVSDNGKGFPRDYLALWERGEELDQSEGRHIGIANIRARLSYAYGAAAAVKFYNSPMGGAAAEIFLPMKKEEKGEHEHSAGG